MKKVREIIAVSILLGCLTLFFFINIPSFGKQEDHYISTKLPMSTVYFIQFDIQAFFKELGAVALFDLKDQDFFLRLKDKISKNEDNSSPWLEMGVDNLAPLEILVCDIDNSPSVFARFKIIDESKFSTFGMEMNRATYVVGEFGYFSINSISAPSNSIHTILEKQFTFNTVKMHSEEIFLFEFENGIHKTTHSINHEENRLSIYSSQQNSKLKSYQIPDENGIELCWSPNSTEKKWLSLIIPSLESLISSIEYMSLNYSGFNFVDQGFNIGKPKGSLLLSFEKPVSIKLILESIAKEINRKEVEIIDEKLKLSDQEILYCHAISAKSIILSFSPLPPNIKDLKLSTKYFGGNLTALLRFENMGYYKYIIDAIPGKTLVEKVLSTSRKIEFEAKNEFEGKSELIIDKPSGFYSGLLKLFGIFI